jgi:hypothetical protein
VLFVKKTGFDRFPVLRSEQGASATADRVPKQVGFQHPTHRVMAEKWQRAAVPNGDSPRFVLKESLGRQIVMTLD